MLVIFAFQGMCTLHLGCQIYWCCAADGEMEGSGGPAAAEDRGRLRKTGARVNPPAEMQIGSMALPAEGGPPGEGTALSGH